MPSASGVVRRSHAEAEPPGAYNDRMHRPAHLGIKRQFNLRGLLIVIAAAAVLLSLLAARWREQERVAALLAGNPNAVIRYGQEKSPRSIDRKPTWSDTLGNWLALVGLARAAAVELTYPTDDDVHRVARLGGVRELRLERALDLTDAGMSEIASMPNLRVLEIEGADYVTDKGLAALARASNLEHLVLDVRGKGLTESGIEQLKQSLPRCRVEITDANISSKAATTSAQTSRP
jgi:hypothetical protein